MRGGQITVILSSFKQSCQLLPTRWDVIVGCVNVPSSHYSTYLTCLSPAGVGFIYLQLSLQISHFLRCSVVTLPVIEMKTPISMLCCQVQRPFEPSSRKYFSRGRHCGLAEVFAHSDIWLVLSSRHLNTRPDQLTTPSVCVLGSSISIVLKNHAQGKSFCRVLVQKLS